MIGTTKKKRASLIYKGYEFWRHKVNSNGSIRWRCIKYKISNCKCAVTTDEHLSTSFDNGKEHCHEGIPEHFLAKTTVGDRERKLNEIKATESTVMALCDMEIRMEQEIDATQRTIKIGIIGGSGLNNPSIMSEGKEKKVTTMYGEPSDVLIEGKIAGVDCVILARHGRKHTINPSNVNYRANIWALKEAGCTHVIVSTACGSLQEHIKPGDLAIVDSFIDRTRTRIQTFYDGAPTSLPGVVHMPMEPAFCPRTRKILLETAKELDLSIHDGGTVVTIEGPRFSSLAESNLFRSWGASLINMSIVPEVCLAKEAGLIYAAVAMATDYDCWRGSVVNVEEVLKTFKSNCSKIEKLFLAVIPKIAAEDWEEDIRSLQEMVKNANQTAHSN